MKWMTALLFSVLTVLTIPGRAVAGTVTGVRASAPSVAAGASVSVTVSGSNPCGAAFIDYGDGTAITYAITGLPTTQTHAYAKPGAYSIAARGMGNCDGEVSTKIQVTGEPAPAPPSASAITGVTFTPNPGRVRQPIAIAVAGRGTCAFVVNFGDGNQQDVNATLPYALSHTYALADNYTIVVAPTEPCTGKFTNRLPVTARGEIRVTDVTVDPSPANVRQGVTITVSGAGACSYRVDYGDGNGEDRSTSFPDRVHHVYNAPGTYTIVVTGTSTCRGRAERSLDVR